MTTPVTVPLRPGEFAASQCVTSAPEPSFIEVEGLRTAATGGTAHQTRGRTAMTAPFSARRRAEEFDAARRRGVLARPPHRARRRALRRAARRGRRPPRRPRGRPAPRVHRRAPRPADGRGRHRPGGAVGPGARRRGPPRPADRARAPATGGSPTLPRRGRARRRHRLDGRGRPDRPARRVALPRQARPRGRPHRPRLRRGRPRRTAPRQRRRPARRGRRARPQLRDPRPRRCADTLVDVRPSRRPRPPGSCSTSTPSPATSSVDPTSLRAFAGTSLDRARRARGRRPGLRPRRAGRAPGGRSPRSTRGPRRPARPAVATLRSLPPVLLTASARVDVGSVLSTSSTVDHRPGRTGQPAIGGDHLGPGRRRHRRARARHHGHRRPRRTTPDGPPAAATTGGATDAPPGRRRPGPGTGGRPQGTVDGQGRRRHQAAHRRRAHAGQRGRRRGTGRRARPRRPGGRRRATRSTRRPTRCSTEPAVPAQRKTLSRSISSV